MIAGCCAACAVSSQLEGLIAALTGADDGARWRASLALGKMGEAAVPALARALGESSLTVRAYAANAVRDIGPVAARHPDTVPALAENLLIPYDAAGDPVAVRRTAGSALGALGEGSLAATPAVVQLLNEQREDTPAAQAPSELVSAELRSMAAWILQRIGPAAAQYPKTVSALAAALHETELIRPAIRVADLPASIDVLQIVRLGAAATLTRYGTAAVTAVPDLVAALADRDAQVCAQAALALGAIGAAVPTVAAQAMAPLRQALRALLEDGPAHDKVRRVLHQFTGEWPPALSIPAPPAPPRWPGLDREDFYIAVAVHNLGGVYFDPHHFKEAFLKDRLANMFSFWVGHTVTSDQIPTAEQLGKWGVAALWYFFTNDPFNAKHGREMGFSTLEDYNTAIVNRILHMGKVLGQKRVLWSVGHEQYQTHAWPWQDDGSQAAPQFNSKREGYQFFRRRLITSEHTSHWVEYGSTRPHKFVAHWKSAPATWEFLKRHGIDPVSVTMACGQVDPTMAHAEFDLLPQIRYFWWETQILGKSMQVGAAYVRGAARQYGRGWILDASPWSIQHGSPKKGEAKGTIAEWKGGATDPTQQRSWTYAYLSGADVLLEESSCITHYYTKPGGELALTTTGQIAQEVADFCFVRCPERGEPYSPVALLLEHVHGYEPSTAGPWGGYMPKGEGEQEIDGFWDTAYPGHGRAPALPDAPETDVTAQEGAMLAGSTFGDCFDVLTDRCPTEVLCRYPRVMTLGGITMGRALWAKLKAYMRGGGELAVNAVHLAESLLSDPIFGCRFGGWIDSEGAGDGVRCWMRILEPHGAQVLLADGAGRPLILTRPVGRGRLHLIAARHSLSAERTDQRSQWLPAIAAFLRRWLEPVWPAKVTTESGVAPQVMLNRLQEGWLLSIGNHSHQEWAGMISLCSGASESVVVEETWERKRIRTRRGTGTLSWRGRVPPYSFRVYRVAPRG
jgi:HEAT repeat protein